MELLKKFLKITVYLVLMALGIYFITGDTFDLTAIARYFKDADTWSLIFAALTFGGLFGLFILFNYLFDKWFKRIGAKYPKLNFINSELADYLLQLPAAFLMLMIVFLIGSNIYILYRGNVLEADSVADVPDNSPVFVLGTAKYLASGNVNLYYKYRIDAAEELWKAGKVKQFILSGDGVGEGHTEAYDETKDMREDLIKIGVPENKIAIDKFGFNTQQSIIRLRGVFRLNNIVVISQDFHNLRAVVLCDFYGIESLSYNAKGSATFSMLRKEVLISRPRIIVDMLYANMQPQVSNDGEFAYREEFDATKSNKHVLIILIMVLLFVVGFVGYGTFRAKTGPERKKVALRLSTVVSGLTLALGVLVYTTYKTLDIRFIDEIVETTAKAIGTETSKMVERKIAREKKEVALVDEKPVLEVEVEKAPETIEAPKEATDTKKEAVVAPDFNTAVADPVTTNQAVKSEVVEKKQPVAKEEDPFNSSVGEDTGFDSETEAEEKVSLYASAVVHGNQEVQNDGRITLRLDKDISIDGKPYKRNFIFEGKCIVFGGRYIVVAALGKKEFRNYQNGKEGNPIETRHTGKKGEVLLSDGEKLSLQGK